MKLNQYPSTNQQRSINWPCLFLLPLCLALIGTGCTHETKTDAKPEAAAAADTNPAGTYTLVSVDGNKVPCAVKHDGASPTIKSGTFIINSDGTCSSKILFALPSRGDTTREVKAAFTREGSKLTMRWEGAGTTVGTVEGDSFTMNNEGMVFAYRK